MIPRLTDESDQEYMKRFMAHPDMMKKYPDPGARMTACKQQMQVDTKALEEIECRLSVPLAFDSAEPPEEIMYLPGGTHHISAATTGGKPIATDVQIDSKTAALLQTSLSAHLAAGKRPWFDFDHERAAASGYPKQFRWADSPRPGVYCKVEWSKLGAEQISGKAWRSFSPSCLYNVRNAPARVTGANLNMGGLVNDPAYKEILPLWAKDSRTAQAQAKKMNEQELAELQAKLSKLERENAELKAKAASSETETAIAAKDAEITTLNAKILKFEEIIAADHKAKAKEAVDAAVARGALPPKDEAIQAKWRGLIETNPENAELLAKQPGAAAVGKTVTRPEGPGARKGEVTLSEEDIAIVCKAYMEGKTPMDRGRIYRKEINARLDKHEIIPFADFQDRLPIDASNTLGTLVGNIVTQRTLALVYAKRPLLKAVVTDFSDQGAKLNQPVYTRTIGLPTVQDFPAGAASSRNDTDYPVVMDQAKQVMFVLSASDYLSTARDLVGEQSEALAIALGNYLVDFIAALITANFTAKDTFDPTATDYPKIIAITKALNVAGVPDMQRHAWINSDMASSLREDEVVMANFDRNNSSGYAHWTNVEGFDDIWEYPSLPDNSINLTGFFSHVNALLLVSRTLLNPEAIIGAGYPGRLQSVTDPVTGLTVISNQFVGQTDLAVSDRLIVLFGGARGNLTCGRLTVSA